MDLDCNVPLHTSPTNRVVNRCVIYSQKGGCHMIESFRLVVKSTPTDRLVDESSIFVVHINMGSRIS